MSLLLFLFPEPEFHYIAHAGLEPESPACLPTKATMRDVVLRGGAAAYHISTRVLGSKTAVPADAAPPLSPSTAFCTWFEDTDLPDPSRS